MGKLVARLTPVLADLRERFDAQLVLVDDGSVDGTYASLRANFGAAEAGVAAPPWSLEQAASVENASDTASDASLWIDGRRTGIRR